VVAAAIAEDQRDSESGWPAWASHLWCFAQSISISILCAPCAAELVLPAFVRSRGGKKTVSCIDSSAATVCILLPTKSSAAPFLSAESYKNSSLRLAGESDVTTASFELYCCVKQLSLETILSDVGAMLLSEVLGALLLHPASRWLKAFSGGRAYEEHHNITVPEFRCDGKL